MLDRIDRAIGVDDRQVAAIHGAPAVRADGFAMVLVQNGLANLADVDQFVAHTDSNLWHVAKMSMWLRRFRYARRSIRCGPKHECA